MYWRRVACTLDVATYRYGISCSRNIALICAQKIIIVITNTLTIVYYGAEMNKKCLTTNSLKLQLNIVYSSRKPHATKGYHT